MSQLYSSSSSPSSHRSGRSKQRQFQLPVSSPSYSPPHSPTSEAQNLKLKSKTNFPSPSQQNPNQKGKRISPSPSPSPSSSPSPHSHSYALSSLSSLSSPFYPTHCVISPSFELNFFCFPSPSDSETFIKKYNNHPNNNNNSDWYSPDLELRYEPFFGDFGPLNLGASAKFIQNIEKKKKKFNENPKEKENKQREQKLQKYLLNVYCTNEGAFKSNLIVLLGFYLLAAEKMSLSDVLSTLKLIPPSTTHSIPFRDASTDPNVFPLRVDEVIKGISRALDHKFFDFLSFNISEYNYFERVENGDLNVILPNKFIAFAGPHDAQITSDGQTQMTPDDYIPIFKIYSVTNVIRLNSKCYDKTKFEAAGITHNELFFPDGSTPSQEILKEFLRICYHSKGVVSVHCKAGLGRTGTLIACYLMLFYDFTPAESIGWIRVCRPGSIIGPQQTWLKTQWKIFQNHKEEWIKRITEVGGEEKQRKGEGEEEHPNMKFSSLTLSSSSSSSPSPPSLALLSPIGNQNTNNILDISNSRPMASHHPKPNAIHHSVIRIHSTDSKGFPIKKSIPVATHSPKGNANGKGNGNGKVFPSHFMTPKPKQKKTFLTSGNGSDSPSESNKSPILNLPKVILKSPKENVLSHRNLLSMESNGNGNQQKQKQNLRKTKAKKHEENDNDMDNDDEKYSSPSLSPTSDSDSSSSLSFSSRPPHTNGISSQSPSFYPPLPIKRSSSLSRIKSQRENGNGMNLSSTATLTRRDGRGRGIGTARISTPNGTLKQSTTPLIITNDKEKKRVVSSSSSSKTSPSLSPLGTPNASHRNLNSSASVTATATASQ